MSIAYMKKTNRIITEDDRAAAARLRLAWEKFRQNNQGISQEKAGEKIGFSQAVFSQYLRCTIPMGAAATLKLAKLLGVKPSYLRPEIDFQDASSKLVIQVKEPDASYGAIPEEALDVARAWLLLAPERRRCFKDQLFLEAAASKNLGII